jgi:hypothetical protein
VLNCWGISWISLEILPERPCEESRLKAGCSHDWLPHKARGGGESGPGFQHLHTGGAGHVDLCRQSDEQAMLNEADDVIEFLR